MTLKHGQLCEVVGGVLCPSPNLNAIVEVTAYAGEHTLHGPIYRCKGHGKDLVSELGVIAIALDFAEDWLRPIPDDEVASWGGVFIEKKLVA